jgi:hypothetical protein
MNVVDSSRVARVFCGWSDVRHAAGRAFETPEIHFGLLSWVGGGAWSFLVSLSGKA